MLRARPKRRARRLLCALALVGLTPVPGGGAPTPGACPTLSGERSGGPHEDAAPARIREGAILDYADVLRLRTLLPVEVWRNRDAFFHEGMQLEVGPCHRRYPTPAFFAEATRRGADSVRLDEDGNLLGHRAGLPFPPERIDPRGPDAGLRWAWNLERRYRGAGPAGNFRLVDMPSRFGGVQTYRGSWFFLQTGQRADLPDSGYALPAAPDSAWIAGGRFDEPAGVRHLAWRQLRPLDVAARYSAPDDTFVYVPGLRKVRRAGSAWVDGVYMPRYRVGGADGGGALAAGGGQYGPSGALNPSAAEAIAVTEHLRRGFEGLALRPNAYHWRVLGEREVLAPLNVTRSGYPLDPDRNFGPSGLSVGNDRWDVRHAVVIQGARKEPADEYDLLTWYVDTQTLQPLYVIARRRGGGQLLEVGILLHRFSGDLPHYPRWPGGAPADVFDPVAAVFHDTADGGSGWRRESYDVTSVPRSAAEIERLTSPGLLDRGR
ncbi:MAG TPA: DUF1329 domain-containing protein [Myxococcota bacterium]